MNYIDFYEKYPETWEHLCTEYEDPEEYLDTHYFGEFESAEDFIRVYVRDEAIIRDASIEKFFDYNKFLDYHLHQGTLWLKFEGGKCHAFLGDNTCGR